MTKTSNFDNSINKQPVSQFNPKLSKEREWTHDLCECCDDFSECCLAFFCPLIYLIKLTKRAKEPCYTICCGGLVPIRTKLRIERKITGSIGSDYCHLIFCPFCSMVQMSVEARDTEALI